MNKTVLKIEIMDIAKIDFWNGEGFGVDDVCRSVGVTAKALEHFLRPKGDLARLFGPEANPGTGRRRRFTGEDVFFIAACYAMSNMGLKREFYKNLKMVISLCGDALCAKDEVYRMPVKVFAYVENGKPRLTASVNDDAREFLPSAFFTLDISQLFDQVFNALSGKAGTTR